VGGQTSYYPAKFSRFIVSYTPSAIMTANIDDPVAPDGTTWDQHVIDKTKLKLEEAVRQTILSPRAGGVGGVRRLSERPALQPEVSSINWKLGPYFCSDDWLNDAVSAGKRLFDYLVYVHRGRGLPPLSLRV
jgi:hypothetical protein